MNWSTAFGKIGPRPSAICALVALHLALAGCSQPVPLTAAESTKVDRAMVRVEAEQQRTDQAEMRKQAVVVEAMAQAPRTPLPIAPLPTRARQAGEVNETHRTTVDSIDPAAAAIAGPKDSLKR